MLDKNNEVLFGEYCKTCKYERYSETDSPCAECLAEPVNLYSHKPVKWEGGRWYICWTTSETRSCLSESGEVCTREPQRQRKGHCQTEH